MWSPFAFASASTSTPASPASPPSSTSTPRVSSLKTGKMRNSTALQESSNSRNNSNNKWSSPFSTIFRLFITVLVIARIKSKPSETTSHEEKNNKKKQVRIDVSGSITTPGNKDNGDIERADTDETRESAGSRGGDKLSDGRLRSEEKSGYEKNKSIIYKMFAVASLGAIAVLLYAFFSK